MAAKEIVVKKCVARLNRGERSLLETPIRKGSNPAQRLLKARILLKADVKDAGEEGSDNQIIEAPATGASMVYRARKQRVEDGVAAVPSRKPRATPSVLRIFDGEKEAKPIALACSGPLRAAPALCRTIRTLSPGFNSGCLRHGATANGTGTYFGGTWR
ncbi:MAG: hypothetical protein WBG11_12985 [Methylocella sp.]